MTTKKPEQMRAEDWTSHFPHDTTNVRLPKHLKHAKKQIRNLEYRILEAERVYKELVEKLYDTVIRHDNSVYIGLGTQSETITQTWDYLCGLRRAHDIICGNGRLY